MSLRDVADAVLEAPVVTSFTRIGYESRKRLDHWTPLDDYDQVRTLADRVLADHARLDVLIHNAGALANERHDAADGTEATVASQVVGPFLLTGLLHGRLVGSAPSRVLTMS